MASQVEYRQSEIRKTRPNSRGYASSMGGAHERPTTLKTVINEEEEPRDFYPTSQPNELFNPEYTLELIDLRKKIRNKLGHKLGSPENLVRKTRPVDLYRTEIPEEEYRTEVSEDYRTEVPEETYRTEVPDDSDQLEILSVEHYNPISDLDELEILSVKDHKPKNDLDDLEVLSVESYRPEIEIEDIDDLEILKSKQYDSLEELYQAIEDEEYAAVLNEYNSFGDAGYNIGSMMTWEKDFAKKNALLDIDTIESKRMYGREQERKYRLNRKIKDGNMDPNGLDKSFNPDNYDNFEAFIYDAEKDIRALQTKLRAERKANRIELEMAREQRNFASRLWWEIISPPRKTKVLKLQSIEELAQILDEPFEKTYQEQAEKVVHESFGMELLGFSDEEFEMERLKVNSNFGNFDIYDPYLEQNIQEMIFEQGIEDTIREMMRKELELQETMELIDRLSEPDASRKTRRRAKKALRKLGKSKTALGIIHDHSINEYLNPRCVIGRGRTALA